MHIHYDYGPFLIRKCPAIYVSCLLSKIEMAARLVHNLHAMLVWVCYVSVLYISSISSRRAFLCVALASL